MYDLHLDGRQTVLNGKLNQTRQIFDTEFLHQPAAVGFDRYFGK
jgi:hypothetical protein